MSDLKRVKKIINWLIFKEYAENERGIADIMGYTKSSFSQIINGKVPLSDKFIDKLSSIDSNVNKVWIESGEGEMIKSSDVKNQIVSEPQAAYSSYSDNKNEYITLHREVWEATLSTIENFKLVNEELYRLIDLLREQNNKENKDTSNKAG